MHITDWFSPKWNTFYYGKMNEYCCLERNAILASTLLPNFGVARCHQLNPMTEYNLISPTWSPQMSILRWFTPVVLYSNVLLKENNLTRHIYQCSRLLASGLLTSHHQIFFFIKSRPVKLILAKMTEISFLSNIHHNTKLNKFVKYELWRMEKHWAIFLNVKFNMAKTLTLRRLMSYIYGAPILDVSRSHTTTQHSR